MVRGSIQEMKYNKGDCSKYVCVSVSSRKMPLYEYWLCTYTVSLLWHICKHKTTRKQKAD